MTLFLYLCSPGYHPWYIIWCLPFAAASNSRWLITGAVAFSLAAFIPVLALNWQITIDESWHISNPVEWATVVMWVATALAGYIAWRGRDSLSFGGANARRAGGPRFAPRQRKRSEA
jgi:hypothetical protein